MDVILLELWCIGEMFVHPTTFRSTGRAMDHLYQHLDSMDRTQIQNAFRNAHHKNFITQQGQLTKLGKQRIHTFLPRSYILPPWDKKWEIVVFDIPERARGLRNTLRTYLRNKHFGKLQASVWISPLKHSRALGQLAKDLEIEPYLIVAYTTSIGKEHPRALVERLWHLESLNQEYKRYIQDYGGISRNSRGIEAIAQFLAIFQRDPQFPLELLPRDWRGEGAFRVHRMYVQKR